MNPWAKAGAYMGLVFVIPIAGWLGWKIGMYCKLRFDAPWAEMAGLLLGLAAGFYETYRQAVRIENGGKGP